MCQRTVDQDPWRDTAAEADAAGRDATRQDTAGHCVGITIPIPEPLASELENWRASFGDPMATLVPPHITLVTTTPSPGWDLTLDHARAVAASQPEFTVSLSSTGSFRPVSPVVFLRVEEGFDTCVELHSQLQSGPLERDLDFPFHPHVTVAHDVSEASMDSAEAKLSSFTASFTVRTLGVYEHDASGLWKLREELNLGAVVATASS